MSVRKTGLSKFSTVQASFDRAFIQSEIEIVVLFRLREVPLAEIYNCIAFVQKIGRAAIVKDLLFSVLQVLQSFRKISWQFVAGDFSCPRRGRKYFATDP